MNDRNSGSDTPQLPRVKDQSNVITPLNVKYCDVQYGSVMSTKDDATLIKNDKKIQSKWVKLYRGICKLTIEPVVFCYMLAFSINISCISNLMMDKGCLYHLNYSSELCKNISQPEYKDEKNAVETLAADYSLYFNCMGLISAFSMIFIAPWSDKYSRKIPLLLSLFGATITDIGFIFCCLYFELKNEYLLLSRIPSELFGGFICALAIIYSHASEVSTMQFRTVKYALVQAAFGLGISLGALTGGLIYKYFGYVYIYMTAVGLHVFCFLWVVFIVEETTGLDVKVGWSEKLKDFFVCQNMKAGVKATFRRREENHRTLIILLICSMCTVVLTYECFSTISYVFVHHIYDWDPSTYNFVFTVSSLVQMPITIVLVPVCIRVLKTSDYLFGLMGIISMIMKNILISFAIYHTYIYYIGTLAGVLSGLTILSVRSGISKIVEKDELGRVFSFLASCEAIIPIFGTIGLTKIFTATLDITPNIAYLSSALSLLLPLFTFIWAIKSTSKPYHLLNIPSTDAHVQEKAQDA